MDISINLDCKTHVCRVCLKVLSKSCQFFRLNPVGLNTQPDATLRNKLCDCFPVLNLNITPNAVLCENCAAEVDAAHKFKTKCLQTEDMIDNYMKRLGKVASVDLSDVVYPSPEESCNVARSYIRSPSLCSQVSSVIMSSPDSSTIRRGVEELDTQVATTAIKREVKVLEGLAEDDSVEMVVVEQAQVESTTVEEEVEVLEDDSVEMTKVQQVSLNESTSEQIQHFLIPKAQVASTTIKTEVEILEWSFVRDASSSDVESNDNSGEMAMVEKVSLNEPMFEQTQHVLVRDLQMNINFKHKINSTYQDSIKNNIEIPSNKQAADSKVAKSAEDADNKHPVAPLPATTNSTANRTRLTPFKCNYCAFTSIFQEAYIFHLRMHTGEKPFKCDKCYYSSAQRLNLVTHMKTHFKECYQCGKCSYRTEDEDMFSEHMKNHPQRSYPCIYCNYRTTNQSGLTRHMRSHNGSFKYKCRFCPFTTNGNLALIRHVNTHIKPFRCNLCNYRTSANHWFQMHIKKHSN